MALPVRGDELIEKRTPMWVRVIIAAIAECGDDEKCYVEMRKAFELLPELLRIRLVVAAYNYPGDELRMVRRLVKELPDEVQANILYNSDDDIEF